MGKKQAVGVKKPNKGKSKSRPQQDHKVQILQVALAEAIGQNQILRKRVSELEALLVAAQMQFGEMAEREERKEGRDDSQFQGLRLKRGKVSKS